MKNLISALLLTFATLTSILMRWTNLEPIIQSEVSWKEKDILMHIYGI